MKKPEEKQGMKRRDFVSTMALTAATVSIVPSHVLGGPGKKAPSDKLNIACVGIGGKGHSDTMGMKDENIIALCDVDKNRYTAKLGHEGNEPSMAETFPKAKFYQDFRVMLEKEKDIDAVTVSTPDHTHAVVAAMAMKMGKHVFVQKPLTHTIHEARVLRDLARKHKVITQQGNQGHSGEGGRLVCEWIWDGAIGDLEEVHCWTNRPIWPQGQTAPKEIPSVPPNLDWDLWLGPAAWRPYHPDYVPFSWRGWWDFGTGAIGDMGAHIIDHAYWPLKLAYPKNVHASSTPWTQDSPPQAEMIEWTFETEAGNDIKLKWFDGGLSAPRPDELEPGRMMGDRNGGVIFIGSKGKLMCSCYGRNPRLIPETSMKAYTKPEKTIPRSPGIQAEWIQAIKENKPELATTNFEYSVPLVETMLMGNVAVRMSEYNKKLEYDSTAGKFTNLDEANELLHMEYRKGWTL